MKNFKFNERNDIEEMIKSGHVDEDDYRRTIGMLALYNDKVAGMKREDSYDSIKEYMSIHARDFFEPEYQTVIYNEIRNARKRILRDIDGVSITKQELAKISELNDIKKEKIAFVLVATAKYYDAIKHADAHYTNLKNSEICKMARITMKSSDRDAFMQFLYEDGVVAKYIYPDTTGKKILFVSDDEPEIQLNEIDFDELAYVYLNWKNSGGFKRCACCGRLMKDMQKTKPRKYCEECAKVVQAEQKREFYERSTKN